MRFFSRMEMFSKFWERVVARWQALTSAETGAGRHAFLDGLRGWGALSVMLLHYSCAPGQPWAVCPGSWFLPLDGQFAVRVFFAASAFSLCCIEGDARVARSVLARYPRLAVPVVFHGLLDSIIFPSRARVNVLLPLVFFSPEVLLYTDWPPPQPMADLQDVRKALFTSWGHLWTMSIEMHGSLGVFLWAFLRTRVHLPLAAAAPVLLVSFALHPCYADFALGCILHAAWPALGAPAWSERRRECCGALALCAVIAIGAIPGFNSWVSEVLSLVRVTAVFVSAALSHRVRNALTCRASLILGRISFTLYVSHQIVLRAVASAVDGASRHALPKTWSLQTAAIALPCAVLWSSLASSVDAWATHASRAWAGRMLAEEIPPAYYEAVGVL